MFGRTGRRHGERWQKALEGVPPEERDVPARPRVMISAGPTQQRVYALIESRRDQGGGYIDRTGRGGDLLGRVNTSRTSCRRGLLLTCTIYGRSAGPADFDTVYAVNTGALKFDRGRPRPGTAWARPHGDKPRLLDQSHQSNQILINGKKTDGRRQKTCRATGGQSWPRGRTNQPEPRCSIARDR